MTAAQPAGTDTTAEQADSVVTRSTRALEVPDLDARFRLKVRSLVAWFTPLMYEGFSRRVDVAALRGRGMVSVVTYLDFRRGDLAAAVAAPVHATVETRHSELAGVGLDRPATRLGFDIRYSFATPPGAGEPRRYREQLSAEPLDCGAGRVVLTLLNPDAPPAERLVREPQAELGHLRLHVLKEPHPTVESLSERNPGFVEAAGAPTEVQGRFGLQHTDVNQYVYTGEYTAAMEDMATRLAADAGLPADRHAIDRIAAVFKAPFSAGDSYVVRGRLFHDGERTVTLVGIHFAGPDGPRQRPAVFGRVEGAC
ncbi:hypothetical protein [Streptomyces sp. NPDC018833]|uniref:hypothetical protein n=1 Tax=Streptomyces sp. NPDC018833 TaxID=3365053 RepID=UPI0037A28126